MLKRELLKNYKFNEYYNIIGDYDLIIRTRFDILFNRKGDISKIVHMIMKHKHNIDTFGKLILHLHYIEYMEIYTLILLFF